MRAEIAALREDATAGESLHRIRDSNSVPRANTDQQVPTSENQTMTPRPQRNRRCQLSVPGSSEKMMQKAAGLGVDYVFLDLEDAVAPRRSARRASASSTR